MAVKVLPRSENGRDDANPAPNEEGAEGPVRPSVVLVLVVSLAFGILPVEVMLDVFFGALHSGEQAGHGERGEVPANRPGSVMQYLSAEVCGRSQVGAEPNCT